MQMEGGRGQGVVLILGTGGTIAGVSTTGDDRVYQAAQLPVSSILAAVPELAGERLEAVQVAQVDSKDAGWPMWRALLAAVLDGLARPEVDGLVITHGTDTLEETACLLHWLLPAGGKPVILTAAMRPATSPSADGPGNLRDAVRVVRGVQAHGLHGVAAVMHARVWAGVDVRKAHAAQLDAFDGGDAAPLALVSADGALLPPGEKGSTDGAGHGELKAWPVSLGLMDAALTGRDALPRVELVVSHGDTSGAVVDALLAANRLATDATEPENSAVPGGAEGISASPLRGLVVAGTGGGTVHSNLERALARAEAAGVAVWRSSRVARGGVLPREGDRWPAAGPWTAAQARLGLSLLLALGCPPDPRLLTAAA